MKRICIAAAALILMAGCSTVTIKSSGTRKITSNPDYSESKSFYLLGLVGEHSIDVRNICSGRTPVQMQTVSTFTDRLLEIITIGIYAPRTAKVWCSESGEDSASLENPLDETYAAGGQNL